MAQYLLDPKVVTCNCNMLTQTQLNRLLRNLKSKRFGTKLFAVDVEEITTDAPTLMLQGSHYMAKKYWLSAGTYFNVHVEYVV